MYRPSLQAHLRRVRDQKEREITAADDLAIRAALGYLRQMAPLETRRGAALRTQPAPRPNGNEVR